MKKISRRFSYRDEDLKASKYEDKDFQVFNNFPFFVNINIEISYASDCQEKVSLSSSLSSTKLGGKVLLSCVEVSVGFEIMLAMSHTQQEREEEEAGRGSRRRHSSSKDVSQVKSLLAHNKFLSLIREQKLAEHEYEHPVRIIEADTKAGFYGYMVIRHEAIIADLECIMHFFASQACGIERESESESEGGREAAMHCVVDRNEDSPRIEMRNRVGGGSGVLRAPRSSESGSVAQLPVELKIRLVLSPRLDLFVIILLMCPQPVYTIIE
jgi:hypothetical protein